MKCEHCKEEFEPTNKRQKFCSDTCRKRSHDKKNNSIAKIVTENKKPTADLLELIYPNIPEHLRKRANKISVLRRVLDSLSPKALEVVEWEIERLEEIFHLQMEIEEDESLIPGTDREKEKQAELNVLLEKEKLIYAKRKERRIKT